MREFKVAPGPHDPQLAIQAHDLSLAECRLLRSIVTNQWTDSEDYRLGHDAGVFLQGYEEPRSNKDNDGWALVEFWTRDMEKIEAFTQYVNCKMKGP